MNEDIDKIKKNVIVIEQSMAILKQSIIGLCSIALAHMDNGDFDKARETILGTIISIEGGGEQ